MRAFETWDTQDIEMTFGLQKVKNFPLLNDWLASTAQYDEYTTARIEKLRDVIFDYADYWNEDELKMQGISQIIDIADLRSQYYTIFSQRPLRAVIKDIEVGGRVDFMLARGQQKPIQPYFFIQART
jgi:hypothetical protein